jgi:hypothetical protein
MASMSISELYHAYIDGFSPMKWDNWSTDEFTIRMMCENAMKTKTNLERIGEFKKTIESIFVFGKNKDLFVENYCKLLQIRSAFKTFLKIYRWKKTPVYNTDDLLMNPVREGQKNTLTIMQNGRKYIFTVKELINHLKTALLHSPGFFSEPIPCKNPYTNQPFTKSELYSIYFAIRESTFLMPPLIHQFFLTGFHLQRFLNEHEDDIRDEYIVNYVNTMGCDHSHLRVIINEMLEKHGIANIKIHPNFPKKTLLEVMRPYLMEHYKSEYSLKHWTRAKSFMKLNTMLHELEHVNPAFGRKQFKITSPFKPCKKEIGFNQITPSFKKPPTMDFMQNHLQLKPGMTTRILNAYERMQNVQIQQDDDLKSDDDDEQMDDDDEQTDDDDEQMELEADDDDSI